jgi:streptomycin 6-kinase
MDNFLEDLDDLSMDLAIDLITNLRKQRDAARRIACEQYARVHSPKVLSKSKEKSLQKKFAEIHGWDCLK